MNAAKITLIISNDARNIGSKYFRNSIPYSGFYLKLIYNFILQLIIMYYITFKIKFLLLPFNLTPFLRKKRLPASAFALTSSLLKPVI